MLCEHPQSFKKSPKSSRAMPSATEAPGPTLRSPRDGLMPWNVAQQVPARKSNAHHLLILSQAQGLDRSGFGVFGGWEQD